MNGHSPRPAPPPGARPVPPQAAFEQPATGPATPAEADSDRHADTASGSGRPVPGSGHPAVDAVLQGIANVASLAPADQIAQYEAAHRVLRETLATIDQS